MKPVHKLVDPDTVILSWRQFPAFKISFVSGFASTVERKFTVS
jgi:hypothetical protein